MAFWKINYNLISGKAGMTRKRVFPSFSDEVTQEYGLGNADS